MAGTFASTPTPPYYAVVFSSQRHDYEAGYSATAERMSEVAAATGVAPEQVHDQTGPGQP